MATQEDRPSLRKRRLEDISATQADHTRYLTSIAQTLNEQTTRFEHIEATLAAHTRLLQEILLRLPAKE